LPWFRAEVVWKMLSPRPLNLGVDRTPGQKFPATPLYACQTTRPSAVDLQLSLRSYGSIDISVTELYYRKRFNSKSGFVSCCEPEAPLAFTNLHVQSHSSTNVPEYFSLTLRPIWKTSCSLETDNDYDTAIMQCPFLKLCIRLNSQVQQPSGPGRLVPNFYVGEDQQRIGPPTS